MKPQLFNSEYLLGVALRMMRRKGYAAQRVVKHACGQFEVVWHRIGGVK